MIGLLPLFLYWEVQPLNSMFFGVYSPHSFGNFTSSNSLQTTTTNIVWIMICVEWMYLSYRETYLTNNKKLFCILQWYSIYQNKPVSMPSEPIWWTSPHGIVTEWTAWGSSDRNRSNRACTGPGIGYLAEVKISFQVVSSIKRPRFRTNWSWQALGSRHWTEINDIYGPKQNGHHYEENIYNFILWNKHYFALIHDWQKFVYITVTSYCAWWRLKSPASTMFAQPFIQAQIKGNIKAPVTGEFPAQMASKAENISIW